MISLINHDFQWGRSEVVIIYPAIPGLLRVLRHEFLCGRGSQVGSDLLLFIASTEEKPPVTQRMSWVVTTATSLRTNKYQ